MGRHFLKPPRRDKGHNCDGSEGKRRTFSICFKHLADRRRAEARLRWVPNIILNYSSREA